MTEFQIFGDGIYVVNNDKAERLTNFTVVVQEVSEVYSSHGAGLYIHLEISNPLHKAEHWLPLSGIESFDPSTVNSAFTLICPSKQNRRLLARYIRQEVDALADVPVGQKYLIDRLGDICINGTHYHATGNELLGPEIGMANLIFSPNIKNYVIENSTISEDEAYGSFYLLCDIEPMVSTPLALYVLSTFGQEIYIRAGMPEAGAPLLVGHSQSRKTTLAVLATSFYVHKSSPGSNKIRLDSTVAGISKQVSAFRGSCVVVDDNFRSGNNHTNQTLQTLLRQKADRQERITAVSTSDITGTGLVFTSEYLLDKRTDLARTQALLVNEPINSERLSEMQENVDSLVCFYKSYICWLYRNYDSILAFCNDWVNCLKIERVRAEKPWQRADDHMSVAELSAELYIKYGFDNGFISEKQAKYLRNKFSETLSTQRELELSLNAEISRRSGEKRIDVAKAILSIFNNGGFSDDPNDYFVRVTSNIECLYISPDILAFTINAIFKYNHDKKFYLKQLSRIGALITEPSRGNVKRFKGKDYAVIRLNILENYSHSLNSLIDQYMA